MYTEQQKLANKKWQLKHPGYATQKAKEWQEKNHIKYNEKSKQYSTKSRNNNPFQHKIYEAKKRAKQKNIEFNLNIDYLKSIWTGICPIFNVNIFIGHKKNTLSDINIACLDRIDNTKGYIIGNVQFISKRANTIKNDSTFAQFKMLYDWYIKFNKGNT